jgi:hypothetical protein
VLDNEGYGVAPFDADGQALDEATAAGARAGSGNVEHPALAPPPGDGAGAGLNARTSHRAAVAR